LRQESLHGVPRSILLSHHFKHTLKYIIDWLRWDTETLDLINVRCLQGSYGRSSSIDLRLYTRELILDLGASILDDLLILVTFALKFLDLSLILFLEGQRLSDLLQSNLSLLFLLIKNLFLLDSLSLESVDLRFCITELL
jgi:hypothetical protein